MMEAKQQIIILGGGLSGLTAGIHLSKSNFKVLIIEKNEFPKHKVCGEYISNEVLPYLKSLDLDIKSLNPTAIDRLHFSLVSGKSIHTKLTSGGFGVSRFSLDDYLNKEAQKSGCSLIHENVVDVSYANETFFVMTENNAYQSLVVLGAFGKRSNLDVNLNRKFIQNKSPWLGVKAHYKVDYPDDLVGLHHFKGGYCGVSKVENNIVNICYLANYDTFKKYKLIEEYQQNVVSENPILKRIFENATMLFEKPLSISQISFEEKAQVENHILMIGDTAGLIHPLCGNGMAMAIHSAKIASEVVIKFLKETITRDEMESNYLKKWNFNFNSRLKTGRRLGSLLEKEKFATVILKLLIIFPFIIPIIIKKTHGKPI